VDDDFGVLFTIVGIVADKSVTSCIIVDVTPVTDVMKLEVLMNSDDDDDGDDGDGDDGGGDGGTIWDDNDTKIDEELGMAARTSIVLFRQTHPTKLKTNIIVNRTILPLLHLCIPLQLVS
jgi:hypothetical protein